jgi:hypothetical protein
MKIEQNRWTQAKGWEPQTPGRLGLSADLVLLFGSTAIFKEKVSIATLQKSYPKALLLGC